MSEVNAPPERVGTDDFDGGRKTLGGTPKLPKTTALAQWYGSNRNCAAEVGKLLEGCNWVGVPFAGGMCELLHITARTLAVNDLHRAVINMARVAANPTLGPKLYRELRRIPFHPIALLGAQVRCRQREATGKDPHDGTGELFNPATNDICFPDKEWALDYFIATWMGRGGTAGQSGEFNGGLSVRWNATGGDSATRFYSALNGLPAWRRVLRRCTFHTLDALAFIKNIKDEPGHGIYCDPPFPGPGDLYAHRFDRFKELATALGRFRQARVVCRFYDNPFVREWFPDQFWTWNHVAGGKKRTNEDAPEVLLVGRKDRQGRAAGTG